MNDAQSRLDKSQAKLQRTIKGLDLLAREAGKAADELCAEGDVDNSSAVGLVGSELRAAGAHADRAYRLARALNVGGVQARSGKD